MVSVIMRLVEDVWIKKDLFGMKFIRGEVGQLSLIRAHNPEMYLFRKLKTSLEITNKSLHTGLLQ